MMIVQKKMEVVEALRKLKKNNEESALLVYRQKRREYKQTLRSKKREQDKVRNLEIETNFVTKEQKKILATSTRIC